MKIVVDTNVLISAFIATGTCKDILEYAVETHEIIISPFILKELKEKLIGKLGFSKRDYREIRDLLQQHVSIIRERKKYRPSFSDKKDIPILQLCLTVNADILITGDMEIQKLKRIGKTQIITPSEFWEFEKNL